MLRIVLDVERVADWTDCSLDCRCYTKAHWSCGQRKNYKCVRMR